MVLDRRAFVLGRMWCLFESSIALRKFGATKFKISASGLGVHETEALFKMFEEVDISRAETSSDREKIEVLGKVRNL